MEQGKLIIDTFCYMLITLVWSALTKSSIKTCVFISGSNPDLVKHTCLLVRILHHTICCISYDMILPVKDIQIIKYLLQYIGVLFNNWIHDFMFFGDPFVDPLSESHCNICLCHKKIDQVQVQFRQFVIALIFLILHFFLTLKKHFASFHILF